MFISSTGEYLGMSKLGIRFLAGSMFFGFCSLLMAQQASGNSGSLPASAYSDALNSYCVACHNDTLKTAGLSLQGIDVKNIGSNARIWEKVLRKLQARIMPPAGMSRPDEPTYLALAGYLESELDRNALADPEQGAPTFRRLNRTEYLNSVRDLLSVEVDENLLPPDDAMFGFDNIGAVLTLSPLLGEQYIAAARKIRLRAIGNPDLHPGFDYYSVSQDLRPGERNSENLPFGSHGGIAVQHNFPLDGEYVIQVRLQKNYRDYIRGLNNKPHLLDIRLNGARVKLFEIGGEVKGRSAGVFSTGGQGDPQQEEYERYVDEQLEVRFPAKAGTHLVTAAFLEETMMPEQPLYPDLTRYDYTQYKGGEPGVRSVAIGGPFEAQGMGDTASRERIFICRPASKNDDQACAERILTNLARLAYRRSPEKQEIDELLEFYQQGNRNGGFESGIGMAIERMLAGPEFLFVLEEVPEKRKAGEIYPLSDRELATRLSLFLWSSIPDEELLSIAENGRLGEPQILEDQVKRMLADPRSQALIDNFASQWLNLGKLNIAVPDSELFPYFDENLRQAFETETKLFFEYIFRNELPLMELLSAEYTFLNERLAKHYGIQNVYGSHFRKVSLEGQPRGGLLAQGSILTVTSYANRTAPTIRGKWILENILSAPPPAPPANVPGLRNTNDEGKVLNMRGRMEQHRANPVCASCHKVMDPLGFALENYDAIGTWRTLDVDSNTSIDASGSMPDGTKFDGLAGLQEVLHQNLQRDFVLTVIEKLLTYALSREIRHTDAPAMRAIMRASAPDQYNISSLILSIIKSRPFLMREVPDSTMDLSNNEL